MCVAAVCVCVCMYQCVQLWMCVIESRIIHLTLNTHPILHHKRVIVLAKNKCIDYWEIIVLLRVQLFPNWTRMCVITY